MRRTKSSYIIVLPNYFVITREEINQTLLNMIKLFSLILFVFILLNVAFITDYVSKHASLSRFTWLFSWLATECT